jgi:hypothetical protein
VDEQSGGRGRLVLEAVLKNQKVQMVDYATHTKGNMLDLVVTNCPDRILTVNEAGRLGRSDHEMIVLELLNEIEKSTETGRQRKIVNWRRGDYSGMKQFFLNYQWRLNGTVTDDWNEFKNVINYLVENFIPVLKMRNKQHPKWLTTEIVRLI